MGFCEGTFSEGLFDVRHHVRHFFKKIEIPNYLIYRVFTPLMAKLASHFHLLILDYPHEPTARIIRPRPRGSAFGFCRGLL